MQNMEWRKVLSFILLFIPWFVSAQREYPGEPAGPGLDKSAGLEYIKLADALSLKVKAEQEGQTETHFKTDIFAAVVPVNIDTEDEGAWTITSNNRIVWRLGITSEHASSLGVTFSPFNLVPGAYVFVYTPGGRKVEGAYTFRNNNPFGLLTAGSLAGDSIIVELQLPSGISKAGVLGISTVSVGFPLGPDQKSTDDQYYGRSEECNLDINCINNAAIQVQKFSVCRLIIEDETSRTRCTGVLLNNTNQDGKPYVLTAGHCLSDSAAASRTLFYFDYESPYCNGPDGEIHSLSGSYLRSSGDGIDFTLLEILESPPVEYSPLYAGWDISGAIPQNSYSIHHPQGDVKKASIDTNRAAIDSFDPYEPNTFWLIEQYEKGTTENGSSGAPLFNEGNYVVGTLTGGGTACSNYVDDVYQQISHDWDDSPAKESQLKVWLDPKKTGQSKIGSYNPFYEFAGEISNITDTANLDLIQIDQGWGYISGHNSIGSRLFAEHYYRNGSKYIYAMNLKVAKAAINNPGSFIMLKIWNGHEEPQEQLFEKKVYMTEIQPVDDNLILLDTLILVNKHFFVGYEIFYTGESIDTFAIYTGLRDTSLTDIAALMNADNGWQRLNNGVNEYDVSLAVNPMVLDYYPIPGTGYGDYPFDEVTIYPNPSYDEIQILFENRPAGDVSVDVYDLLGNFIYSETFYSPEPNLQMETGKIGRQGFFILRIKYNGKSAVKKFIKLQR